MEGGDYYTLEWSSTWWPTKKYTYLIYVALATVHALLTSAAEALLTVYLAGGKFAKATGESSDVQVRNTVEDVKECFGEPEEVTE